MKKDNYRDYVCEAFRYYAQCGQPDSEKLRQMRLSATDWQRAGLNDLEAVYRVIKRLQSEPDGAITYRCLDLVYFANPSSPPSRGAISSRVTAASRELSLSEAVIYRILRRLRLMLATERGLRISSDKYSVFLDMHW